VPIVELLLKVHGINLNSWLRGGHCSPLIEACRKGHLKIINLLLAEDSVDINLDLADSAGTTPFMAAARIGLVEVVESLLARENFDPNIVTESGEYALGDAASRGDVDVMKLLLDRPAGIDTRSEENNAREKYKEALKLALRLLKESDNRRKMCGWEVVGVFWGGFSGLGPGGGVCGL